MNLKRTVLLADDHALMRAGIRALLATEPDLDVIGETDNGREAVRLACSLNPDLVMLDLNMPGSNGLDAIAEIKKRAPGIRILVVTMHKTDEYLQRALRAGASGYMLKESSHDELRVAVRTVLAGQCYLSPAVSAQVVSSFLGPGASPAGTGTSWDTLTTREREVLKLVAEGKGNKNIADYLCLSVKTVEKHRSNLMRKLNLRNAAMLTAYAIERGLVNR
jgi:DNA-binding NarL/FixJ family response regulator